MAPIRTYSGWNKRSFDEKNQMEPYRKYFFICEGENTEVWYFRHLIDIRKQLGIHPLIDIRLMEKTEEDRGTSNPKPLIEFANAQKRDPKNNFDIKHDKMIIVFDSDVFKDKEEQYKNLISSGGRDNILAVTNPSFELFLLLHFEGAFEEIINPREKEILANRKIGKRRCINVLFTEKSGMNPKENSHIGELANNVDIAIAQERKLNQDICKAIGKLTCNIGKIIQMIREDDVKPDDK